MYVFTAYALRAFLLSNHLFKHPLKLPTIGLVKTFEGLPHTITTKITISRVANDWFIAFAYEQPKQITDKSVDVVGVDLGIKELATLSTGIVFPNPKYYKKGLAKLKRLSKKLARKQLGSNRRNKARLKLAEHHAKVANTRIDSLHKITTYLCKNHGKSSNRRLKRFWYVVQP